MLKPIALFLLLIPFAQATSNFTISPYTLTGDKGEIYLKFQTNKALKLNVSTFHQGDSENIDSVKLVNASPKKLVSLNLGKQTCGSSLGYTISSGEKKLVTTNLPTFDCHLYDEFTFGFLSDTQSGPKYHQKVANVISEKLIFNKVNFILHTGDITHKGGENSRWLDFFDVAKTYLGERPIIAAIGNHAYWKDKKNLPLPGNFKKYMRWEGSEKIGYMTAVYPTFQLVIINSIFEKLTGSENNKQLEWLEDTLKEAKLENRPVIMGMHYPPFSSSYFTNTREAEFLKTRYVPLFEKYGVKLVLNGHTHVYERSFKNGIHYVIAGPAGGTLAIPTGRNPHRVFWDAMARTFSLVTIKKDQITLKTFDGKNREIDNLEISL
jgi:predicted MPP superfamily phosphohydrolase